MTWLTDLLKEFPSLSVARERLALVQERLKQSEAKSLALQTEVDALRRECPSLQRRIADTPPPVKTYEFRGVLWKEQRDGLIEPIAYCPECKLAMSEFPPRTDENLICTKCNFVAPFPPSEVRDMALRLEVELIGS